MGRNKKNKQQGNSHQKPIIWHILTNDIVYEEDVFCKINGDRNTTACQVSRKISTQAYGETDIVTTGFVNNSIVALGNYKLYDNNKTDLRSLGTLNPELLDQFFDSNSTKTLVVSEGVTTFIQPPILNQIKDKGRQSVFLYLSSTTPNHPNLMRVIAQRNWIAYHNLKLFEMQKETTAFTSITDFIANILTDAKKKETCYQSIPITKSDMEHYYHSETLLHSNFFLYNNSENNTSILKQKEDKRVFEDHRQFMLEFYHTNELECQSLDPWELPKEHLLHSYDRLVVQKLFEEENIELWYFHNCGRAPISTTSGMRQKVKIFLHHCFPQTADRDAINKVLTTMETKFLVLTNKEKCIGCVIFKYLDEPPFGAFISYVAIFPDYNLTRIFKPDTVKDFLEKKLQFNGLGKNVEHCSIYNMG